MTNRLPRFYVECANHHVGYYSVFDRLTHRKVQPDVFDQLLNLPLDFDNEFGNWESASQLAEKANMAEDDFLAYLDTFTDEDLNPYE